MVSGNKASETVNYVSTSRSASDTSAFLARAESGARRVQVGQVTPGSLAPRLVSAFWLVRKGTDRTGFEYARVLDDGAVVFGPLKGAQRFELKADAMALARRLMAGRIQMTLVVISFDLENDNG